VVTLIPLTDTDPDAAAAQLRLLRAAPLARRVGLALALSRQAIALARRALRRTLPPGSSDEELGLRFVELHYGRDLGARVRERVAVPR
jgi:hypothetical protein